MASAKRPTVAGAHRAQESIILKIVLLLIVNTIALFAHMRCRPYVDRAFEPLARWGGGGGSAGNPFKEARPGHEAKDGVKPKPADEVARKQGPVAEGYQPGPAVPHTNSLPGIAAKPRHHYPTMNTMNLLEAASLAGMLATL